MQIYDDIVNRDVALLIIHLKNAPIENLESEEQILLFMKLLAHSELNDSPKNIVLAIVQRWFNIFRVETLNQAIAYISGLIVIPMKVKIYMVKKLNISLYDVLQEGIDLNDIVYPMMVDLMIEATGKGETINWQSLMTYAIQKKNLLASMALENKVKKYSDISDVPSWVIFPKEEKEREVIVNACTFDAERWLREEDEDEGTFFVKKVLNMIEVPEETHPALFDTIVEVVEAAKMVSNAPPLTQDPDSIFGPLNRRSDGECVTGIKGGCRMLTCNCRGHDEEEDEPEFDSSDQWFEGSCDTCYKRIVDISHSIRLPLKEGGFVGSFCGEPCLRNNPPRDIDDQTLEVLSEILKVLKFKGILDRTKVRLENQIPKEDEQDLIPKVRQQPLKPFLFEKNLPPPPPFF